ncbi:MAG: hypothetical protein IIX39_02205 [Clostridia bacterium]|nr:hypothetical protein [Clostridia bacterium]
MKKFLSVLCAVALFMTMSIGAFAVELPELDQDTINAVSESAQEIIGQLVSDVNSVLDKADAKTLREYLSEIADQILAETGYEIDVDKVADALIEKGIDVDTVKVLTASQMDDLTQAIFDSIEEEYGEETVDNFYETLKNSGIVNWFANLYVQTPDTTEEPVEEPETEEVIDIPEEEIPATGDVSVIGGVAVLAVAIGTAFICTKKAKKDEE